MLRRNWLKSQIEEWQESRFSGGSSAGDGANDITSRVEPWSEAKRHFTKLYGLAEAAYGETNTNPYPGEFIAGENSYDKVARNQVNFAQEQMAPDFIQVRRLGAQIVTGYFLDPSRNTTLVNSVNVAVDKASAALLEDVIPQVLDVAIQSGAYSGTGTELMTDRAWRGSRGKRCALLPGSIMRIGLESAPIKAPGWRC